MPMITIDLPSMLRGVLAEPQPITVEAATFAEAIERACTRTPALRGYLFDESGQLRQHVLIFLNDTNSRWIDDLNRPLREGDCITVLQAVSGG